MCKDKLESFLGGGLSEEVEPDKEALSLQMEKGGGGTGGTDMVCDPHPHPHQLEGLTSKWERRLEQAQGP